jgi:hypothetical protein
MEQRAAPDETSAYELSVGPGPEWIISPTAIIETVLEDVRAGVATEAIAVRFHNTLAELIGNVCKAIREQRDLTTVALSGGVFQNELLLTRTARAIQREGFRVRTHSPGPHQRWRYQPWTGRGGTCLLAPSFIDRFFGGGLRAVKIVHGAPAGSRTRIIGRGSKSKTGKIVQTNTTFREH